MNALRPGAAPRTVGVEEELLLVDPLTGVPAAAVEPVLTASALLRSASAPKPSEESGAAGELYSGVLLEREAKQEQIEVITSPCATLEEVSRAIATGRHFVDLAARAESVRSVALGTSALPVQTHLARGDRYRTIHDLFRYTMGQQLTCGLHVHVGIESDEEGVAALDGVREWLPVLLALSANSPMWEGQDTGFASYRYQMWGRWPASGVYEPFGSVAEYHRMVESLVATGVLLDRGMVYFDARLSHHNPTVEIRIADICMKPAHAVAITGLVRALVDTALRRQGSVNDEMRSSGPALRLATWAASRYGLTETLVDPVSGRPAAARNVVDRLLEHTAQSLGEAGDRAFVERTVDDMFSGGTGAERQRAVLRETGSLAAVVSDAIEVTHSSGSA